MSGNSASSASSAAAAEAAAAVNLTLGHSYACVLRDGSVITGIVCFKRTAGSDGIFYIIDSIGAPSSIIASAVEMGRQEKSIPHLLVYLWQFIKLYSITNEAVLIPNTIDNMLIEYEKTNVTPRTSGIDKDTIEKYFDAELDTIVDSNKEDDAYLTRLMNNSHLYLTTGPYTPPIEIEKKKTPTRLVSTINWDINKPVNVDHYADQTPEQKQEDIAFAIRKEEERKQKYPWYGKLGGGHRRLRCRLTRQKKARCSRGRSRSRSRSTRKNRKH
jgi:hypothetical protein